MIRLFLLPLLLCKFTNHTAHASALHKGCGMTLYVRWLCHAYRTLGGTSKCRHNNNCNAHLYNTSEGASKPTHTKLNSDTKLNSHNNNCILPF